MDQNACKSGSVVPRMQLGNVPLSPVTPGRAAELIAAWAEAAPFRLVVTPNVDHVVRLQADERFASAYQRADLSLIDGVPLLWAIRWLGLGRAVRVAGSDIAVTLCRIGQERNWKVFLMGGQRLGELERLIERVAERFPGLAVTGAWPPFGFENDPAASDRLLEAIAASRPNLLLLGCGAPKSEIWMDRHRQRIAAGVGIGIGAGLEYLAGVRRRAPRFMQQAGLEWLWRLACEPSRLGRRYLVDDVKFFSLVRRWRDGRGQGAGTRGQ